jgi:cytochrome b561
MADLAPNRAAPGYTATARVLHWITAVLVLFQIPAGLLIVSFDLGLIYNLHKSVGVFILAVLAVRLPWRLTHPAPPLPADIPAAQRAAALAMHWLLYALLVIQPLLGWIATSAYPAPVPFFGLFEMPHIWWQDRALSDALFVVHRWLGIVMAVLLVGHIGAALYHHFVRGDVVLLRMTRG